MEIQQARPIVPISQREAVRDRLRLRVRAVLVEGLRGESFGRAQRRLARFWEQLDDPPRVRTWRHVV